MLEAHPGVTQYCERPATTLINGRERLVDFWLMKNGRERWFVISADGEDPLDIEFSGAKPKNINSRNIEVLSPQSFVEHEVWIDNWLSILPYLASNASLVDSELIAQVMAQCHEPTTLLAIEANYPHHDPMLVRSAVFMAVHGGELLGVDLAGRRWDMDSQFITNTIHRGPRAA